MKDIFDTVIGFIKGLMQPLITVFALMVGGQLIASGKVSAEQAWLIPVGVIAYWFADKSGIWDKLFKGESPKVNTSTIGTSPKVEGWGDCDCDECTGNTPPVIPFAPATPEGSPKVEKVIDSIFEDLAADGIKPDVSSVSSRIVSWLGAHEGELTGAERAELIQAGINYASNAYVTVTGLQSVPKFYAEVADYNKWWRNNKAACKAPAGAAKAVLMTLRDLLGRRDGVA